MLPTIFVNISKNINMQYKFAILQSLYIYNLEFVVSIKWLKQAFEISQMPTVCVLFRF